MICYRNIELTELTWRAYITEDDPERPTENAVFRKLRAEGQIEIARWYRLRFHYEMADLHSLYKFLSTIYFNLGDEWQSKL